MGKALGSAGWRDNQYVCLEQRELGLGAQTARKKAAESFYRTYVYGYGFHSKSNYYGPRRRPTREWHDRVQVWKACARFSLLEMLLSRGVTWLRHVSRISERVTFK